MRDVSIAARVRYMLEIDGAALSYMVDFHYAYGQTMRRLALNMFDLGVSKSHVGMHLVFRPITQLYRFVTEELQKEWAWYLYS